ncbi:MAG TPA: hypothetical protein VGC27_02530 [Rhizomicrobium sp.]
MKLVHTVIWALLASAIIAIPALAFLRRFDWIAVITGLVVLEGIALRANGGRCPLRSLAAKYTDDRRDGFDIYLPGWLARNTMPVFGTWFVAGELLALWRWFLG